MNSGYKTNRKVLDYNIGKGGVGWPVLTAVYGRPYRVFMKKQGCWVMKEFFILKRASMENEKNSGNDPDCRKKKNNDPGNCAFVIFHHKPLTDFAVKRLNGRFFKIVVNISGVVSCIFGQNIASFVINVS